MPQPSTELYIEHTPEKLVSILIPIYNHEEYIQECLESTVNQTYKEVEVIAIDDCSTDSSFLKANSIALKSQGKIQLLRNEKNLGICRTMQTLLSLARGKYICVIASDDYLDHSHIKACIDIANKDDSIMVIFTDALTVDKNSKIIGKSSYLSPRLRKDRYVFKDILEFGSFPAAGSFYRADSLKSIEFPGICYVEDLFMWLSALHRGGYAQTNKNHTVFRRLHSLNTHRREDFSQNIVNDHLKTVMHFTNHLDTKRKTCSLWFTKCSRKMALVSPDYSFRLLCHAIFCYPSLQAIAMTPLILFKITVGYFLFGFRK